MNISKENNNEQLTIAVSGRLDTTTSPELENEINSSVEGITELILDLKGLEYISSAGLRVILTAQKTMSKKGSMIIKNANDEVNSIFEITGFKDILTIQ